MTRFAFALFAATLIMPAASAHEIEAKPAPKLPSADEIAQIQAQMPDLNKMMSGMQALMQDEDLQAGMKSALGAMSEKLDGADLKAKTENGLPDFNAMASVMLSMMGDEQVMGKMMESLEPMKKALPKIMEDAMPERTAPKLPAEK